MPVQIFFSYANAPDILLTLRDLAAAVDHVGLSAWFDRARLVPGRTFDSEILSQINASAAVVLLITPVTFGSEWVRREIHTAFACGKRIIPCFLQTSIVPPALAPILTPIDRLELFHYARHDWSQALLWTLDQNGINFSWPSNLARALPAIEFDIAAINPPYSVLRRASHQDIEAMFARISGGIERNERWGFGHLNLGLIYLHLRDQDRAISALERATQHLPRVADVFYFLALALLAFTPLRRARPPWLTQAESALSDARRLDPSRPVFAILDALITLEHYIANGFRRQGGEDARMLVGHIEAARCDLAASEELDRLAATIPIRDPRLQKIFGIAP
jgi:tetratricopeptide (TPR) repeat protein